MTDTARWEPGASARLILILGAAVRQGGLPSGAMRRRVDAAVAAAGADADALFVPVGGVGRFPPAEAELMTGMLQERGVPVSRVRAVPEGSNTIESLLAAWQTLGAARSRGLAVYVCTDDYHMRRCRMILRLWGLPTRALPCAPTGIVTAQAPRAPGAAARESPALRDYMALRDRLALLKDLLLALAWRLTHPALRRASGRSAGARGSR